MWEGAERCSVGSLRGSFQVPKWTSSSLGVRDAKIVEDERDAGARAAHTKRGRAAAASLTRDAWPRVCHEKRYGTSCQSPDRETLSLSATRSTCPSSSALLIFPLFLLFLLFSVPMTLPLSFTSRWTRDQSESANI